MIPLTSCHPALRARRDRGRNECPVADLWRAPVTGVVFQHPSIALLVRELHRNPALLELCGFDPLPRQGRPRRWVDEVRPVPPADAATARDRESSDSGVPDATPKGLAQPRKVNMPGAETGVYCLVR